MIVSCRIFYFDNLFSALDGLNLKREFREKFKVTRVMDFKGDTLNAITSLLDEDKKGKWLVFERNSDEIMIVKLEESISDIDKKLIQACDKLSEEIQNGRE